MAPSKYRNYLLVLLIALVTAGTAKADHGGSSHLDLGLVVPATSSTGNYTVTWNGTGVQLQEKVGSGNYTNVATGGPKTFSNKPNGTYTYRNYFQLCVWGCVNYYSAPQSIVVSSGPQIPPPPSAITGPSSDDDGSFTLNWGTSSGATSYVLQRQVSGGSWSAVQNSSQTSYSESGLPNGAYNYRGQACSSAGCSAWTATKVVVVDIPTPPQSDGITSPPVETQVGSEVAGYLPYEMKVDVGGNASIDIPLLLIPGVAGFEPNISIAYSSGRGAERLKQSLPEDTIGYGWSIDGLSDIRRCVVGQNDGAAIALNGNDSICLDGMPLVLTAGTHLTPGATYRTKVEQYFRVEAKGTASDLWFQLSTPDGAQLEFGNAAGSRVNRFGGVDYQWSLSKATSEDGNVVNYSYYHDSTNGTNYPVSVEYDGARVEFEYRLRTDAVPVEIGSTPQVRTVFLHTIKLLSEDVVRRKYLLLDEVVSAHRRLNKIQLCGYITNGALLECLKSIDINWNTPPIVSPGTSILVDELVDSLGGSHEFEYTSLTGSSSSGLFTERPFGNGTPPFDAANLSGSGVLRHVVTRHRRDNGRGGYHDTSYAYQGRGLRSTKNWGFLGFFAQRVRDDQSGVTTYLQYRMDFPHFGSLARILQLDNVFGSHSEVLTKTEADHAAQLISHAGGTTVFPYASRHMNFIYEGNTQLGIKEEFSLYSFDGSGFVTQLETTSTVAAGWSVGQAPSGWGQIPGYTLSAIKRTTTNTVNFTNRTAGGDWLVGFVDEVIDESWPGPAVGSSIERRSVFTPDSASMRMASSTRFPGDPELNLTTTYAYDHRGRPTEVSVVGANVPLRTTKFGVSGFHFERLPKDFVNAIGHTTTSDSVDMRFARHVSNTDANGVQSSVEFDPFGRYKNETDGDGVNKAISYNWVAPGLVTVDGVDAAYFIRSRIASGPIELAYFDKLNRLIRSSKQRLNGVHANVDAWYDGQGRIKKRSLPYFAGSTISYSTYAYDRRSRVTSVSRSDGGVTTNVYTAENGQIAVETTDSIVSSTGTNAGSQAKKSLFNILGQLSSSTDAHGTTDAVTTTFTYDAVGLPNAVTVTGGTVGSTVTTMSHDAAGNRRQVVDPDIGLVIQTYDALGQVLTIKDNKNQTTTFSYDLLQRRTGRSNNDGTSTWNWDSAPNGKGYLASRSTGNGFGESYEYDTFSRLDKTSTTITPFGATTPTTYTSTQTYYNTNGLPAITTHADGFAVTRVYNNRNYLIQIKNGSSILKTFSAANAFGQSTQESFGNNVSTTKTYDTKSGRLTNISTNSGANVIQDLDYDWRSNNTLESRTANVNQGIPNTRKESFTYDALNRLEKTETFVNGVYARDLDYNFDKFGNVLSKTSSKPGDVDVTGYLYGAGSAGPHAVTSAIEDGVGIILTYDANGAVTKYDRAGTTTADRYISYNASNQPVRVVLGSSLTDPNPIAIDEFRYDTDGNRYSRRSQWIEGGVTKVEVTTYVGAVEFTTMSNHAANVLSRTKTHVSKDIMRVSHRYLNPYFSPFGPPPNNVPYITTSDIEYAHLDHLGSVESVTNSSGARLIQVAFEPFGSRKSKTWTSNITALELDVLLVDNTVLGPVQSPVAKGFTGHEHMDRTGLVHMNGRVYDPVLGRFLSPDPVVKSPVFSQDWNRYTYTNNNPLNTTDPTGYLDVIVVTGSRTNMDVNINALLDRLNGLDVGGLTPAFTGLGGIGIDSANGRGRAPTGISDSEGDLDGCNMIQVRSCVLGVEQSGDVLLVTLTATIGIEDSRDSFAEDAIGQSGGILSILSEGLDLAVGSFRSLSGVYVLVSGKTSSQTLSKLIKLSKPAKVIIGKLGIAGMGIEIGFGVKEFLTTGNPVPLVVTSIGAFAAVGVLTVYGAPAAFVFGVAYGIAGAFGVFDSDRFD